MAVTGTTEGAITVTTAAITGGIILTGMAITITAAVIGIMAADIMVVVVVVVAVAMRPSRPSDLARCLPRARWRRNELKRVPRSIAEFLKALCGRQIARARGHLEPALGVPATSF